MNGYKNEVAFIAENQAKQNEENYVGGFPAYESKKGNISHPFVFGKTKVNEKGEKVFDGRPQWFDTSLFDTNTEIGRAFKKFILAGFKQAPSILKKVKAEKAEAEAKKAAEEEQKKLDNEVELQLAINANKVYDKQYKGREMPPAIQRTYNKNLKTIERLSAKA